MTQKKPKQTQSSNEKPERSTTWRSASAKLATSSSAATSACGCAPPMLSTMVDMACLLDRLDLVPVGLLVAEGLERDVLQHRVAEVVLVDLGHVDALGL